MKLPTMTVIRDGSPVRINTSDFDPERDKLVDSGDPVAPAAPAVEPVRSAKDDPTPQVDPAATAGAAGSVQAVAPEGADLRSAAVVKRGRKFFITDMTGVDIQHPAVDAKGYPKESDAWDVIRNG